MRLCIANLTGGSLSGGYVKYLNALAPLLRADKRITALDVFVPRQALDSIKLDSACLHSWDSGMGKSDLQNQLKNAKPDVLFIPTARWIRLDGTPTVVMVRNMEPLAVPFRGNKPVDCVKNIARSLTARRACSRADGVIAVSQYVKDFLTRKWHISGGQISVIPHGVETPAAEKKSVQPKKTMSMEPGRGFFFTAGSLRPARGLEDAVKALAWINKTGNYYLVIAGAPNPGTEFYQEQVTGLARQFGIDGKLIWTGQLKPLEMSWCFYHCAAFIMTSRAEACPNIVLEAMAHGCLCVSTETAPMPEFFGKSALYYHPADSLLLSQQLHKAVGTAEQAAKLRALALARAAEFTWEQTARKTMDQLENVLQRTRSAVL